MRSVVRLLPVFLLALAPTTAGGVAELSLDRAAVQDLLVAATPASLEVDPPGWGKITIELGAPYGTDFIEGAVETTLPLRIPRSGQALELVLRYAPEFDPLYGTPRLRVGSARVEGLDLDLAAWLPPVTLPQSGKWSLALDAHAGGRELAVTYFVQGLTVEEERLRLDLGLKVTSSATPASRQDRP